MPIIHEKITILMIYLEFLQNTIGPDYSMCHKKKSSIRVLKTIASGTRQIYLPIIPFLEICLWANFHNEMKL